MKKIVLGLAVAAIAVSCKKELEVQEPMYSSKDTATGRAPQATTANAANPQGQMPQAQAVNPAHGQPGHRCDLAVGAPLSPMGNTATTQVAAVHPTTVPSAAAQPAKTAKGMNPAHGQPGHRCDIAVGAPLNSPAAATPQTTQNGSATVIPAKNPTAGSTKTAPGMNPPHGEPGHRCDIAVGAPLSSAPASTDTSVSTQIPATLAAPPDEN